MIEFYGDKLRWFIGIVESNSDPLHIGRCRVRIYGIHSDDVEAVPESALPWASCLVPTTEDGVSGLGRSPSLKPGAMVFGFFMDGALSQQPVIMGSLPRVEVRPDIDYAPDNAFHSYDDEPLSATPYTSLKRDSRDIPPKAFDGDLDSLVGIDNTEKAFNFLIGNRYSVVQSAAICGNFIVESSMNPVAALGEGGFGIGQWTPVAGRLQRFHAYADDRELSIAALETQLQFFHYEFTTYGAGYGYNKFKAMNNIVKATEHICNKYLPYRDNLNRRIDAAERVLEVYG